MYFSAPPRATNFIPTTKQILEQTIPISTCISHTLHSIYPRQHCPGKPSPQALLHSCWPSFPKHGGFHDILPELLLLVAADLLLGDLTNFRSTYYWVWDILTPRFQKLCLQDVGTLTALQWAAVRGHAELIKLAISNGAEIEAPLLDRLTLRTLGVRGELYEHHTKHPCELANPDPFNDAINTSIRTLLFLAACCGHAKAIGVLLDHSASTQFLDGIITPVHAADTRGDVSCMQPFIRPGFDINALGDQESTILHNALNGGVEMVMYILQLDGGTNVVNARNSEGLTPLHIVTLSAVDRNGQRLVTELLLQHGADISVRDNRGDTPAHCLASRGNFECLRVLIDAGFDLHTRGEGGQTVGYFRLVEDRRG